LGDNHGAPPKTLEKVPFLPNSGRFSAFLVGHHGFPPKLQFFLPTPRPIAELQSYVGFFEISSVRPRSIYAFAGFASGTGPKLGGKIPKKGAKILPPENIDTFLDSEFDVDFNFVINHGLIP